MLLRLVPEETAVPFLKGRFVAAALSALLMLASLGLFFAVDLNYGIDFKGGISIEIGTEGPVPIAKVRDTLSDLDLGDVSVQEFGQNTEALISIERQAGGEKAQTEAMTRVRAALSAAIEGISFRQENSVGPQISGELKRTGAIAVSVAVLMVLIYIWLRFEWQFGLGAVIALVHDVVLTIGFFAVTQLEFNLSIIAAILTIVGYSLNDTVVVYDRVRENIRRFRKMDFVALIDTSLNQTLSRTVMTSVTTLIALVALYVFGGEVIRGFTAAMIWGVVVGTYSSIFVAAPVLTFFPVKREAFYAVDEQDDPTVDKSRADNPFAGM